MVVKMVVKNHRLDKHGCDPSPARRVASSNAGRLILRTIDYDERKLLSHSEMRTTMEIYSHVMPALAREASDARPAPDAAVDYNRGANRNRAS
jgi:hypothetical protein